MRSQLNDWKNGWFGLELAMSPEEIEGLIVLLQDLLADPDQHFHISSEYEGTSGLGDILLSVKTPEEPDDIYIFSKSMLPGEEI
jgi:hypothetical protein